MAWIDEALRANAHQRESRWTESVAVGSKGFIVNLKEDLGHRARGRRINESESGSELRECVSCYKANFDIENSVLSQNNSYFWKQSHEFPEG
jgi:putative transposase